jgi:uncharacterized protein YneF (UPF0154 family)
MVSVWLAVALYVLGLVVGFFAGLVYVEVRNEGRALKD